MLRDGKLPADESRKAAVILSLIHISDAKYAAAMDRIQPLINNYLTKGHTWKLGRVSSADVYKRMDMVRVGTPALWPMVEFIVNDSIRQGFLQP